MQGTFFRVMDFLVHHVPCALYLAFYSQVLLADPERRQRVESVSEWYL